MVYLRCFHPTPFHWKSSSWTRAGGYNFLDRPIGPTHVILIGLISRWGSLWGDLQPSDDDKEWNYCMNTDAFCHCAPILCYNVPAHTFLCLCHYLCQSPYRCLYIIASACGLTGQSLCHIALSLWVHASTIASTVASTGASTSESIPYSSSYLSFCLGYGSLAVAPYFLRPAWQQPSFHRDGANFVGVAGSNIKDSAGRSW